MNDSSNVSSELELSSNYSGELDANNLKTGIGEFNWNGHSPQRYQGRVFQDCIHGRGRYTWIQNNETLLYEGYFFANNLEGYGKFYYPNSSVFEGLFKNNERFGPGVHTHRDGSQNVGMWYGPQLIRLCVAVQPHSIPRLATSLPAKVRLLRYKKLVSVREDSKDRATETLKLLDSEADVLKQSDKLYNIHVRNPQSRFFNTLAYERRYFCEKDCYIDVAFSPSEELSNNETNTCDTISEETQSIESTAYGKPWGDLECVCEVSNQIRSNGIKQELQRTDELLRQLEWDLRVAKRRKQIACRQRQLAAGFEATIKSIFKENEEVKSEEDDEPKTEKPSLLEDWIAEDTALVEKQLEDESDLFDNKTDFQESKMVDKVAEEDKNQDFLDENKSIPSFSYENLSDEESLCDGEFEEDIEEVDTMLLNEAADYESASKMLDVAESNHLKMKGRVDRLIEKLILESNKLDEVEGCKPHTKRILISDLLAWNNGNLAIEMMKHTFLYRNFENTAPFSISDILTGNRSTFASRGTQEYACVSFLKACMKGNVQNVIECIYNNDLNPDICDSKGNTGIIFASAQDQVKVMKRLVNLGANVDAINDECFTPLGLCVTRYLATQKDVVDWERAFLKPSPEPQPSDISEWRPHVSIVSLNNFNQITQNSSENLELDERKNLSDIMKREIISEIFGSEFNFEILPGSQFLDAIIEMSAKTKKTQFSESSTQVQTYQTYNVHQDDQLVDQKYILDVKCVIPKEPKGEKEARSKLLQKGKSAPLIIKKEEMVQVELKLTPEELKKKNELEDIYKTIVFLLERGANPNVCKIPLPTLILSVYTSHKELVEGLLDNGANPDIATLDELLTALHVAVAHPPSLLMLDIVKLLLEHNADRNCRTSPDHWSEEKGKLVGKKYQLQNVDFGKTPLHLLAMRYDFKLDHANFLQQMAVELIQDECQLNAHYLGHTPLSIALLRGNAGLLRTILQLEKADPNKELGENMGVLMTVYVLQRYADQLPSFEICELIIDLLIQRKANPLNLIGDFGNAIDFMILEHKGPLIGQGKDKGKKSADKKSPKGKKDNTQDLVKKHLEVVTKNVLDRHIKGWLVRHLYKFVEAENYYDDSAELMAKFVTVNECIELAQELVHAGAIPLKLATHDNIYDLVEFIINVTSQPTDDGTAPSSKVDIERLIASLELKIRKGKTKPNLLDPAVETHSDKYEVCYECLRKKNTQLFLCDKCKLIYFCSLDCNKNNNKQKKSIHVCRNLFYKTKLDAFEKTLRLTEKPPEQDAYGAVLRNVVPDENRRLHLTRSNQVSGSEFDLYQQLLKKFGTKEALMRFQKMMKTKWGAKKYADKLRGVGGKFEKLLEKGDKFASVPEKTYGRGDIDDSSSLDGGTTIGRNRKGRVSKGDMEPPGDKKTKSKKKKGDRSDEESESKKKKGDRSDEESKSKKKKGDRSDEESKIKKKKGDRDDSKKRKIKDQKNAGKGKTKKDKTDRGSTRSKSRESKKSNKEHDGVKKRAGGDKLKGEKGKKGDKTLDGRASRVSGRKSRSEDRNQRREQTGSSEKRRDASGNLDRARIDPCGRPRSRFGDERLGELQRRLPDKYQAFLEKIVEFWPDFDLSMLFLPYVCYNNGQLYYRFLTTPPIFVETFSSV